MTRKDLCIALYIGDAPYLSAELLDQYSNHFFRELFALCDRGTFKFNLYANGSFLSFIQKRHAPLLAGLKSRVRTGAIEVMGGAFQDPVLPLLPKESQVAQIERMNEFLMRHLGIHPRGFWLPGFVWEIPLIELLSAMDYEYLVLKDYQLQESLSRHTLKQGFWTMEDRGKLLRVLPACTDAGELFKAGKIDDLVDYLVELKSPFAIMDIPFFRARRGYYEAEWFLYLNQLVEKLEAKSNLFQSRLLSGIIDNQASTGSMHLSSSVGRHLSQGVPIHSCRDLLIVQPECNYLHKKMLYLQRQLATKEVSREKTEMEDRLMEAQRLFYYRNQPGLGGVPYLEDRMACIRNLLQVEMDLKMAQGQQGFKVEVLDFLANGSKQILCSNPQLSFLVEHRSGARLRSLEYFPKQINLINGYNQSFDADGSGHVFAVTPVSGLRDRLIPKSYLADNTLDHCLAADDFVMNHPFEYQIKKQKEKNQILLQSSQIFTEGISKHEIRTEKVLSLSSTKAEFVVSYALNNATFLKLDAVFGIEFNISLEPGKPKEQVFKINGSKEHHTQADYSWEHVQSFEFKDQNNGISFSWEFTKPCRFLVKRRFTSLGADDAELFQGWMLFPHWELELHGQEQASYVSKIKISRRKVLG
jgi:hypothetical protein